MIYLLGITLNRLLAADPSCTFALEGLLVEVVLHRDQYPSCLDEEHHLAT